LRYCARPPFTLDGLLELAPEHLLYASSKPAPGGSDPLRLTPLELFDRLAALVLPPRISLANAEMQAQHACRIYCKRCSGPA
jgi:hypothetical protein